MTSPSIETEKTAADHAQTFIDWTRINSKALTAGAAVVLVAAVGFWFYQRSQQISSANAEKALNNAKQSIQAGNAQLAQSDLQTVYSRYGSTAAGVEAAMLLAQNSFDSGKPQDGISMLEKVAGSRAAARVESTIRSLEGDGYAQMGKLADAAKQYEAAAAASPYPIEKGYYKAKAARAYQDGGDAAKALTLWQQLATDQTASMGSEAKVRVGELTAKAASK